MSAPIVCPSCRRTNDPWRRYCGGCGSGLPGGCATCGIVNRADDRFCGGCARPLRAILATAAARKGPPAAPPAQHNATMPIDVRDALPDAAPKAGTIPIDIGNILSETPRR